MNFKIGDLIVPKKEFKKEERSMLWEVLKIPGKTSHTIVVGLPNIIDRSNYVNYNVDKYYYRLATTEEIKIDKLKNLFSK